MVRAIAGPGLADDEQAALAGGDGLAFLGDDFRHDAEEGAGGGAGFGGDGAGDGRDEDAAPVSVCHQVSTMGQRSLPTSR